MEVIMVPGGSLKLLKLYFEKFYSMKKLLCTCIVAVVVQVFCLLVCLFIISFLGFHVCADMHDFFLPECGRKH